MNRKMIFCLFLIGIFLASCQNDPNPRTQTIPTEELASTTEVPIQIPDSVILLSEDDNDYEDVGVHCDYDLAISKNLPTGLSQGFYSITANGGTSAGYSYAWNGNSSNANNYTVVRNWSFRNSTEITDDAAEDYDGATYSVTVPDNNEDYNKIEENEFFTSKTDPQSTFSIDVDNASYTNVRRILNYQSLPDPNAVRIEEMVNYFNYDYPQPKDEHPFSINTEVNECPWNKDHKLLHIGLQGKEINLSKAPASNMVFLIDVSGSMSDDNKLPLVKQSLKLVVEQMRRKDKIAIVVYAGAAGLVLPSTSAKDKKKILKAIDNLNAGGSTAGGEGIELAYDIAKENLIRNGNNRIVLCTDGDFNVGISNQDELQTLIEKKRKGGVFLTVLGYGMGNYKDSNLETLADKGNGNYGYIDNLNEAKKMLVNEMGGTFFTIAKDVKIQIEFNSDYVESYRLIGYENRVMANKDFEDDTKDAGELGSGHTVTAMYEIVPKKNAVASNDNSLRYQERVSKSIEDEWAYVQFRYKKPEGKKSILMKHIVGYNKDVDVSTASENFLFAAAVAEWGLLLRDSEYKKNASYESVFLNAVEGKGKDENGYREEFISLVKLSEAYAKDVK